MCYSFRAKNSQRSPFFRPPDWAWPLNRRSVAVPVEFSRRCSATRRQAYIHPNNKPLRYVPSVALILQFVVVRLIQDSMPSTPAGGSSKTAARRNRAPSALLAGLSSYLFLVRRIQESFSFSARPTGNRHSAVLHRRAIRPPDHL